MALPKTPSETAAEPATDAVTKPVAAPAKAKPETAAAEAAAPKAKSEIPAEPAAAAAESLTDVAEAVLDVAEKGVAETQEAYARLKDSVDETSGMIEGSYSTASKGLSTFGLKTLETARANTNAAFDHALALLDVKSLSEAVELNSTFVRKQAETLAQQSREFGELAQKVAAEAAAPVRARFEKAFKSAA